MRSPHIAVPIALIARLAFAQREGELQAGIGAQPEPADAHITYASYLSIFGDQGAAIAEWKRGVELDPFSPLYTAWLAGTYWEFSRPDDAIREAQRALVLQPDFPVALFVLGLGLWRQE
jgi:tetratricopeptide (TPR) repeat protein